MFCYQCEQTAQGTCCNKQTGVCGKQDSTALLQDQLVGALISLAKARAKAGTSAATDHLILESLFATLTNVNFDDKAIQAKIEEVRQETGRLLGKGEDYDLQLLWQEQEDIRSLKSLILFGIKGVAAYAYHAMMLGKTDQEIPDFICKALMALEEAGTMEQLVGMTMETGRINLKAMELLEAANTEAYGIPQPTEVPLKVEKGPFIVITGHDLKDLAELLEQTKGKGINIYTHGEMLPAHAYPKLKSYPHLKGHYGTAWQNQQREFDALPAPILYTTNCITPVKDSYSDRVFTTAMVGYPGMAHIGGERKDFTPVIEKALALGGFGEDRVFPGTNGGDKVATGFSHHFILSHAPAIVDAVKAKAIRHFFLVGGCDGINKKRSYFTEFVKQAPADTLILTLACGKFRFNDLDIGKIGDFPRLMDMGQCNDAYGAIQVAVALANAFGCGVNDLPLTLVLSWYEQKAVSILLTLLHLGIRNIHLGPTLPAFVSPAVLDFLVKNFNITPVSTPEEDLKKILA